MKKIYADIQSLIKNKKNFNASTVPNWPINEINFKKFYSDVLSSYELLIKVQKKPVSDLISSDFRFIMDLINYIHYFCAFSQAKKNNLQPVNFKKVINFYKNKLLANTNELKKKSENQNLLKVKKLIKNSLYSNSNKKKVLVFGSRTENLEKFLKRKKEKPIFDYFKLFFSKNYVNFKTKKIFIKDINLFFKKIEQSSQKNLKTKIDLSKIKSNWLKKISNLKKDYLNVINSSYIKNFKKIYFTDDVQVNHRLISSAAQSIGIDTYRFDHGNNFYFKENKLNKFFLSNYKYNVCENKNSFKVLKKIFENNNDFLKFSNIIFQNISFKKKIKKNLNKNINEIMVVGFPMNTNRYMGSEDLFWQNEFLLELEIFRSLKQKGYKILYKIHPSVIGWENFITQYVDKIIYENFEECWKKADLFIFSHIGSTTFAYALATNIPIILFDNKQNANWNKHVLKYIQKRCSLIDYKRKKLTTNFSKREFLKEIETIKSIKNNLILDSSLKF